MPSGFASATLRHTLFTRSGKVSKDSWGISSCSRRGGRISGRVRSGFFGQRKTGAFRPTAVLFLTGSPFVIKARNERGPGVLLVRTRPS